MSKTVNDLYLLVQTLRERGQGDEIIVLEGCDCTGRWNGEFMEANFTSDVANKEKAIVLKRDQND